MKEEAKQLECGLFVEEKMSNKVSFPFWLIMYYPKAKKPFANYIFRTEQEREAFKQKQIVAYLELIALKLKRRELNKPSQENLSKVQAGDIFTYSWGYEQTNVDFYQVTEKKGQFAIIRKLQQRTVETGFMSGNTEPIINTFNDDKQLKKKIQFYGDKPYFRMDFGSCYKWDGKPERCSWYA